MSKAKFAVAKEFIQDEDYDSARIILQSLNHPTAKKWLARIDELDPPFPKTTSKKKSEQEKYYTRQNRLAKRRAFGNAVELIFSGIGLLGIWALFSGILLGNPISNPFEGLNLIMFLMALLIIFIGVSALRNKKE